MSSKSVKMAKSSVLSTPNFFATMTEEELMRIPCPGKPKEWCEETKRKMIELLKRIHG